MIARQAHREDDFLISGPRVYIAAMSLYDFAHDKQPETETVVDLRSALEGRAALERFEHLVQSRLVDAGTGVSHFEANVVLLAGDRDMDGQVGYAVFDRIDDQVSENPLQALMKTPLDTAIFLVVVVVAGGVREEIQRAFLLRRFEQSLGGAAVGLVITSALFGAGHYPQGIDAVLATATLGAFWGLVYLRRRSAIAPIVSHAGFNVLQLLQFVIISRR